jgi:cellulose biosynthesis protein BcsQ
MTDIICMFNHKGGVSKTTTTFHLGWKLAEMGKRVLLVDADPQCNLTGLILEFKGEDDFREFYSNPKNHNLRSGLSPAFESKPELLKPATCQEVSGNENLFLLPGHISLSEYDVTLSIAQELSGSIQALKNIPGSINHFIQLTAKEIDADIVLIDLNPSLSSMNQNIFSTSNYFIIPTAPDYFSQMALNSLTKILPRWHAWAEKARKNKELEEASYPFPKSTPKFLGTVIQRYRIMKGKPTAGFSGVIQDIKKYTEQDLVAALRELNMNHAGFAGGHFL